MDGAVYYDADEVDINQSTGELALRGNVLFLFGDSFVRCQRLRYHRPSGIAVLEGQVNIFRRKERIRADRVVIHVPDREFYADNIWLSVDPKAPLSDVDFNEKVLGFSEAEVTFESMRERRETDLAAELASLRDQYVSRRNLMGLERNSSRRLELSTEVEETKRRYAQILGRYVRTRHQPNLYLESLPSDQRAKLEKRREAVRDFVKVNRPTAAKIAERQQYPGYLSLTAKSIHQRPDGKLVAESAQLTPCRCGADDIALWGLSTSSALIEPGRYATLYGATVDVASVPAAYVPYIKFPIKTERESGFLLPSIYATRAGQIVSVPYFQTLGEHADATITVDNFSGRGTRLGAELRGVVSPTAKANLAAEYLDDPKRKEESDPETKTAAIDEKFSNDPFQAKRLKDRVGTVSRDRWKTSGSLNAPYANVAAAKLDWTFVSDNQYLSDFSVDKQAKTDLFAPAQSSFRFLSQEAAAEYYGERWSLGVRVQKFQDMLEPKPADTPYRSPKVEWTLYPWRVLQSSVYFEQEASWENVTRDNELVFLDQYSSGRLSTGGGPEGAGRTVLFDSPDGVRNPAEPYIVGQRLWLQSRLSSPLIAHPYLLSSAAFRGNVTAYQFERTPPYDRQTPKMSFVEYQLRNRSVIELERKLGSTPSGESFFLLSSITPFVDLSYIPEVSRDENFPRYYDVFYEADNTTPQQTAFFGIEGSLRLGRETYTQTLKPLRRTGSKPPPEPGDIQALGSALARVGLVLPSEQQEGAQPPPAPPSAPRNSDRVEGSSIFGASRGPQFAAVLDQWASDELERYETYIREQEFGVPNQWPEPPFFIATRQLEATPLTYGLRTSYNFAAKESERNLLGRLRPGDATEPTDAWGDVILSLGTDARPWVPITGSTSLKWNPLRKRFYAGSSGVNLIFPFNLTVGLTNSFENYEVGTTSLTEPIQNYVKRTIGINANYSPRPWLRLTYQRKTESDSQIKVLPTPELRYESLQKISFLKLQDCLDIELTRYKKTAVIERNATWSIGLNLHFLGETKSFDNLGEALNRSVQNRQAEL